MTIPFIIHYTDARCGSGKTYGALTTMALTPGKYVYAVDRCEIAPEREAQLIDIANRNRSRPPVIKRLFSVDGHTIHNEFPAVPSEFADCPHVVVIITHEALKTASHGNFDGDWSLIIDEDMKLWSAETLCLKASKPAFAEHYKLVPIDNLPGFSRIVLRGAITTNDFREDTYLSGLTTFHRRAKRGQVGARLESWDDLDRTGRFTWFSLFDLMDLNGYRKVIILANGFEQLLTFKLAKALYPEIELRPFSLRARPDTWKPRRLTIRHFVQTLAAGSYYFSKPEGMAALQSCANWINANTDPANHLWTANRRVNIHLNGTEIPPRSQGTNRYSHLTCASMIYAAKASPEENALFPELTGGLVTPADVTRDRELEDLLQFAFRLSIRRPDDSQDAELRVFDQRQAQWLADYFNSGTHVTATVNFTDIGIDETRRSSGRRTNVSKGRAPPKTGAERQKAYKARKRFEARCAMRSVVIRTDQRGITPTARRTASTLQQTNRNR